MEKYTNFIFGIYILFNIFHPILCAYFLFLNMKINDYSVLPRILIFSFYYVCIHIIHIGIYIKYIINKLDNVTSNIDLSLFIISMNTNSMRNYLLVYPIIILSIDLLEYMIGYIITNKLIYSYNFVLGNYIFYSLLTPIIIIYLVYKYVKSIRDDHTLDENDPLIP